MHSAGRETGSPRRFQIAYSARPSAYLGTGLKTGANWGNLYLKLRLNVGDILKGVFMKQALFAAAILASSAVVQTTAAQTEEAAPPPSCDAEIYRAFDFWAGDWEVFNPEGEKAGENSITIEENGCLLVEHWQGARGGTGQSYNFYDPGMEKWRQVWVARGATIDYAGGLDADGAMVLEGEIAYRNGNKLPFKGTWTLQDDGSVRQHFQQYNAETEEWGDWFIGVYRKKENAE